MFQENGLAYQTISKFPGSVDCSVCSKTSNALYLVKL